LLTCFHPHLKMPRRGPTSWCRNAPVLWCTFARGWCDRGKSSRGMCSARRWAWDPPGSGSAKLSTMVFQRNYTNSIHAIPFPAVQWKDVENSKKFSPNSGLLESSRLKAGLKLSLWGCMEVWKPIDDQRIK
jgi:hypothetical protein